MVDELLSELQGWLVLAAILAGTFIIQKVAKVILRRIIKNSINTQVWRSSVRAINEILIELRIVMNGCRAFCPAIHKR